MAALAAPPAADARACAAPPLLPAAAPPPPAADRPLSGDLLQPPRCPALESADESELGPAQFALANPVVLSSVFAALAGADLARCAAVCGLWRDLLLADAGADSAIWRAAYLAEHGREPPPREWAGRCGAAARAWMAGGARDRAARPAPCVHAPGRAAPAPAAAA
jgi:hypothetical protein